MSKRNPSRSDRFSSIQSALGNALCVVADIVETLSDAIKDCEKRQSVDEREEFNNPFIDVVCQRDMIESIIDDAKSGAEELSEELQSWLDNMPENMQSGDKASQLEDAIASLEDFTSALDNCDFDVLDSIMTNEFDPEEALGTLEEMQDSIEEAQDMSVEFPGMF